MKSGGSCIRNWYMDITTKKTGCGAGWKRGKGMKSDLPIIIAKNLNKGVMTGVNPKMGGGDLFIVWLKRKLDPGSTFGLEDIEKTNAVLHFGDKESLDRTIDALITLRKQAFET